MGGFLMIFMTLRIAVIYECANLNFTRAVLKKKYNNTIITKKNCLNIICPWWQACPSPVGSVVYDIIFCHREFSVQSSCACVSGCLWFSASLAGELARVFLSDWPWWIHCDLAAPLPILFSFHYRHSKRWWAGFTFWVGVMPIRG